MASIQLDMIQTAGIGALILAAIVRNILGFISYDDEGKLDVRSQTIYC